METGNKFPAPNSKAWRKNALVETALRDGSQPGFNLRSGRIMTSDVPKMLHFETVVTQTWLLREWLR